MADVTYTYSIEQDFGGHLNSSNLIDEIRDSDITIAIDYINTQGDAVYIFFKGTLSTDDLAILAEVIASHDPTPKETVAEAALIAPVNDAQDYAKIRADASGYLLTTAMMAGGDKVYLHSPNWCNKTTWYEGSEMIVEETLVDTGDGLTFRSGTNKKNWIDMSHGLMTDEDYLIQLAGPIDTVGHKKWIPIVTVDGVEKTESYLDTMDGDYQIDYRNGRVTFNASQTGKEVKATYWAAKSGTFTIAPLPGKILTIVHVELQFSSNIILTDTMIFQAYGYLGAFAPQLVDNVNTFDNTLIPIGKPTYYKRASDYINEANGIYPITPAWGGTGSQGWRGLSYELLTFPWNYMTRTDLRADAGMRVLISMAQDNEMIGELATITFYCTSTDIPST